MDQLDLDISHYNLEDILNLFNVDIAFGENELKNAKRMVLRTHPDKSKLDSEIFLFFSKAYKILYNIYNFKYKNSENLNKEYEKNENLNEESEKNKNIIKKIQKMENFNKVFNKLFEENKLKDQYQETGYSEWMANIDNEENIEQITSLSQMGEAFKREKMKKKEMVKYNGIQELDSGGNNYYELGRQQPESYGSGLFSKLQYEDVKKAHTENIIPITDEDNKGGYKNISELVKVRTMQDINPINESKAKQYLEQKEKKEQEESTQRAYMLAKQIEEANEINKNIVSKFNYLTN